jgi:enamine deaminase RidA (YjgF/YER057c/UK114 family)
VGRIEDRLAELGVELPGPMPTAGAYTPVVVDGDLAYTSGMLGVRDNALAFPGCVGADLDPDDAKASARLACVSVLGALHHELGTLDRVERVLRLTGYIRAAGDFGPLPSVLDGASELLLDVFGDAGRHARSAIGVAALPFGGSVEVELVCRVRGE